MEVGFELCVLSVVRISGVCVLGCGYVCACQVYPVCCGVIAAYRCLLFCFNLQTAQGAQPLFARPRISLNFPAEEQSSNQPAGRGPEAGYQKNGGFGPTFRGAGWWCGDLPSLSGGVPQPRTGHHIWGNKLHSLRGSDID